VALKATTE